MFYKNLSFRPCFTTAICCPLPVPQCTMMAVVNLRETLLHAEDSPRQKSTCITAVSVQAVRRVGVGGVAPGWRPWKGQPTLHAHDTDNALNYRSRCTKYMLPHQRRAAVRHVTLGSGEGGLNRLHPAEAEPPWYSTLVYGQVTAWGGLYHVDMLCM